MSCSPSSAIASSIRRAFSRNVLRGSWVKKGPERSIVVTALATRVHLELLDLAIEDRPFRGRVEGCLPRHRRAVEVAVAARLAGLPAALGDFERGLDDLDRVAVDLDRDGRAVRSRRCS